MADSSNIFSTDADIRLLRDAARGMLAQKWPAAQAVSASQQPDALRRIWQDLARQGWLVLGSDPDSSGLRHASVLFDELGRAGCPAPLLDAFLANVILSHVADHDHGVGKLLADLHEGRAVVSVALGPLDRVGRSGPGEPTP